MPDQPHIDKESRFKYLLQGWVAQHLSADEVEEFLNGLQEPALQELLGKEMTKDLEQHAFSGLETDQERGRTLEALQQIVNSREQPLPAQPTRIRRMIRTALVAAAAALICVMAYLNWGDGKTNSSLENKTLADVPAPTASHAILTLPDGTKIKLDSVKDTALINKYGLQLSRLGDGEVACTHTGTNTAAIMLARVDNPRGSKMMKLKLTDGTWVWLNAESSITYPMAFVNNTRKVDITGEVYFEVSKLPGKKFIVNAPNFTTEVLGTHFDVRAYADDPAAKVTLLEGAVKVSDGISHESRKLLPNQQAVVSTGILVTNDVNIDEVMAWKNELLSFNDADIRTIMQEVGRLYNMKVVFLGPVPDRRFSGRFSRNTSLSVILTILQKSNINFKVSNEMITVLP